MMALPFLIYACGLIFVWKGSRRAALASWLIGTVLTVVLFRLHATDPLNIIL